MRISFPREIILRRIFSWSLCMYCTLLVRRHCTVAGKSWVFRFKPFPRTRTQLVAPIHRKQETKFCSKIYFWNSVFQLMKTRSFSCQAEAESSNSSPSRAPAHSLLRLHNKQETTFCSKSANSWLSKSILYVKNYPNLSKKNFIEGYHSSNSSR